MEKIIGEVTQDGVIKRILRDKKMKLLNFTFWSHFSFFDILDYAGAFFVEDNSYEIDRVYISGEFINNDGKKFISTFALNISEIITITGETAELKWKSISK